MSNLFTIPNSVNYGSLFSDQDRKRLFLLFDQSKINYFQAFAAIWICFNAFYKKFSQTKKRDCDQINFLVNDAGFQSIVKDVLTINSEANNSFLYLRQKLEESPLVNLTRPNQPPIKIASDNVNSCDVPNLFKVIYTVRNNLFHGEKSPENFRDYVLIMHCYIILDKILNKLFWFGFLPNGYSEPFRKG